MRLLSGLLCVLLLASPAMAKRTFPNYVTDFDSAMADRVAEIDGVPSPTEAELKERAGLVKAQATLDGYAGTTGKTDLGTVAKALSTAYKSSADSDVGAAAVALLDAYVKEGQALMELAAAARDLLLDAASQSKVDAAIQGAAAIFPLAGAEPDWGKAAKIAMKGIQSMDKAWRSVGKYLDKELPQHTPYVTAHWTGMDFSAPPDGCGFSLDKDGAFTLTGQQTDGEPRYTVSPAALGVFGPGRYSVAVNWAFVRQFGMLGVPMDHWQSLYGGLYIYVLTKRVAAGTFYFTAESTSSGTIDVTSGTFLVPIGE